MDDGRVLAVAAIGALVSAGAAAGSASDGDAVLRFPAQGRPAVARTSTLAASGATADEALAQLGAAVGRRERARGRTSDEARTAAWRAIAPLVDRHRWELEDQGDLVSALLDRALDG